MKGEESAPGQTPGAGVRGSAPGVSTDEVGHLAQVERQAEQAAQAAHAVEVEQLVRSAQGAAPAPAPAEPVPTETTATGTTATEAIPAEPATTETLPGETPAGDGPRAALRLVAKLAVLGAVVAVPLGGLTAGVVQGLEPEYADTFNAAINDRIDRLETVPGPRILLVAGSSGAFGLDQYRLGEALGMPVVNLALQSGFGMRFQTDLVRGNLHPGDVVVIAYEYAMMSRLDSFGAELTMTAFDHRLDRYGYLPRESWFDMATYFPTFLAKKADARRVPVVTGGVYTRQAFDDQGQMVYPRPGPTVPAPLPDNLGVRIDGATLSEDMAGYLNDLAEEARAQGARVVFSYPPVMDEAVRTSAAEMAQFEESVARLLRFPVISDLRDYVLPRDDFFDTQYHCNDQGQEVRTDLLARDLAAYLSRA